MYTIKKASVNVQFMTSPPFQMYLLKKRKVQIKWLFHDIKSQSCVEIFCEINVLYSI